MTSDSLLSVDDARARILAAVQPVGDERLPLVGAEGRVLAETLSSRRDLPPFDNSAMDGVGVRVGDVASAARDAPVRLALVGASLPGGTVIERSLEPGQAVRVMTGAPVPPGVEAIVMREQCDEHEVAQGTIAVLERAPIGQHVRRRGEDVAQGATVGRAGDVITPARLNLILSAGHVSARVHRRPVVGVLASGDELREVGEPTDPHAIVNSNAHAVAAAARALGADVHMLGIAGDSLADHVERIERALFCDAVITIGGVSMGTHDFVRPALEKLGVALAMWRVAMRPGKPVAFGTHRSARIFCLPGNPVSALVSFELFVRPALKKMAGQRALTRPLHAATLVDGDFKKKAGLEHWARGVARLTDGELLVRLLDGQGSHHMSAMAQSNALVRFAQDVERVPDGASVEVALIDDPLTNADLA